MARLTRAVVLGAAVLFVAGCASVETGPPRDVAGTWTGRCFDCPVRVMGADGIPLDASLRVSADAQSMSGQGKHRSAFGLTFTRAGR